MAGRIGKSSRLKAIGAMDKRRSELAALSFEGNRNGSVNLEGVAPQKKSRKSNLFESHPKPPRESVNGTCNEITASQLYLRHKQRKVQQPQPRENICFVCLASVRSSRTNCPLRGGDEEMDINSNGADLYNKLIQFATNYFKLSSSTNTSFLYLTPLEDEIKGGKIFCDNCEHVVTGVCQLYLELLQAELRLSWKLGELGNLLQSSQTQNPISYKIGNIQKLAEKFGVRDSFHVEQIRDFLRHQCELKGQDKLPEVEEEQEQIIKVEPIMDEDFRNASEGDAQETDWYDGNGMGEGAVSDPDYNPDSNTPFKEQEHPVKIYAQALQRNDKVKVEENVEEALEDGKEKDEAHLKGHIYQRRAEKKREGEEQPGPHCEMKFKSRKLVLRHICKVHPTTVETEECSICGLVMESNRKYKMRNHKLTHMSMEERRLEGNVNACRVCGKEFLSTYTFNKHLATCNT